MSGRQPGEIGIQFGIGYAFRPGLAAGADIAERRRRVDVDVVEGRGALGVAQPRLEARQEAADVLLAVEPRLEQAAARITEILAELVATRHQIGRASCRERVWPYV